MSQGNAELLYRAYDAFNRRDIDAFLALCDPDGELISRIVALEGGRPYRGHDGVRRWWENLLAVFPDFSSEIDEVRDLGDVTVARVRVRGHGSHGMESDVPMEQTQWHVIEWRHKKAIWMRICRSEDEALEAAGLSE
jgi:ketosteroid isomerase-like protein